MTDFTSWPLTDGPVLVQIEDDGALWRVKLNTPKANVIDSHKIELLTGIFARARADVGLKAVLLEAEGPHFSFGASVEEHLPGRFETMIPAFHKLFLGMLDATVPTLAAVRGQCLGGALELVSFCSRVFASHDARLGQPEINLGVFAPVASIVLEQRIGRGRAEEMCLSGRSLEAAEAERIGLVDALVNDPSSAAVAWVRTHLLPKSASSLRFALRAVRAGYAARFRLEIAALERLYMEGLMKTADAVEGLTAFVEKRDPVWQKGGNQ